MRGEEVWLSLVVRRAKEFLFTHRRRHRRVRYGGHEFSTPQLLSEALLPRGPAIYAIQVRNWWFGLKPIYFGASQNLHEELMVDGHEGFFAWLNHHGSRGGIFVSFNTTDDLDHVGRHREGTLLTRHYFPRRTHTVDEHLAKHTIHRSPEHRRATYGESGNHRIGSPSA